ncbi:MAG: DUF4998 domain-containing protein [Mangrovibacterium sp.]
MKKISNHIGLLMFLLVTFACEDMMDRHQKFLEGGEKVYAPRVDSIVFSSGNQRIQFEYWLYDAPHVVSINVYWNEGKDSLEIPLQRTKAEIGDVLCDSGKVMIEDLPEGSYTFYVKTVDSFGHYSLEDDGFANSYGSTYEASLANRRVKAISQYTVDGNATIDWYIVSEEMTGVEVRYAKKDGTQATVSLPASGTSLSCPDAKTDSPFEYRTFFLPEPTAIDTFATAWSFNKAKFPFDRSGWEVVGVSDEQVSDGGGVKTILDGIIHGSGTPNNYWHSSWSPVVPLPHWAVIDMKSPRKTAMFDTYRRYNVNATKSVEYYVGNDYTDGEKTIDFSEWTKVAEGIFENSAAKNRLVLEVSEGIDVEGRFLLIYLWDSYSAQSTQISEIFVCGKN